MRHWHLGLLLVAAGCNSAGFEAVSIRPTFGWEDGCAAIKISGHGFADDVSATVGGGEVTDITLAEAEEDRPFFFFGTVPAGDATGPADVTVTSDGSESTIPAAYYYVGCPAPGHVDALTPDTGVAAGDSVSIAGCGLDAATMRIKIFSPTAAVAPQTATLTADCGTAYASFTAPDMTADGTYWIYIEDIATGDILNPASGDPHECNADTAAECDAAFRITYGGAE